MEYRVKPQVPFLSDERIEDVACDLLQRYEAQEKPIHHPPVPVEFVARFRHFTIKSEYFSSLPNMPEDGLAFINPNDFTICLNLDRSDYFDRIGNEFTIAHEIGHFELGHFEPLGTQILLEFENQPTTFLHRENFRNTKYERHEIQAECFAGCLTMPAKLLLPTTREMDLRRWPSIYELAKRFAVSPTAMTKRLSALRLIYVKDNKLYRNAEEANGQLTLL